MFSSDKGLPPPPNSQKPRNESMNSALPSYRNRPSGASSSNSTSHFTNAKSLFESFNTPAVRNGLNKLAHNPLAQKAAVSLARNDQVRTAAVNAASQHVTGDKKPNPIVEQAAHGTILGMVKQFENRPIMGMASPANPTPSDRTSASFSTFGFEAFDPLPPPKPDASTYPSLTAIDPFEYPPQLPTSNYEFANRSKSTEPFNQNGFMPSFDISKKPAPARPPPPKGPGSRSNPNLSALLNSPTETNQPHAFVKYPFKAAHFDELSCEPNDTVILQKEVDEQWVQALNTRTGSSGIVPINFLDIKIPLAPTNHWPTSPQSPNTHNPPAGSWGNKQVARALYDYHSDVDGDLNFNAGDTIVVHEVVNTEWMRGELKNRFGIFPASFVQNTSSVSEAGPTRSLGSVRALYDYNSGVSDDLSFSSGELIEIVEEMNSEWIRGRLNGRVGLVPLTFVQRT